MVTLNAGEIVESDAFSSGLTLRFPRLTKVREGADSKNPSDCESELSLWRIYQEVQQGRETSKNVAPAIGGSPEGVAAAGGGKSRTRFLTEQQYAESKRKKRTGTRTTKKPLGIAVATASESSSNALKGVTFVVIGKGYKLALDSLEMEEAIEQGWQEEASRTKNADAVVSYIKKHGGVCKISADKTTTFVLGGNRDDSKVKTHIKAIENARNQTEGKKSKTKAFAAMEELARGAGVVRWTFVHSLVHRWLAENPGATTSILECNPDMLQPTALDYLARPHVAGDNILSDPSLFEADLWNVSMMKRALWNDRSAGASRNSKRRRRRRARRLGDPRA